MDNCRRNGFSNPDFVFAWFSFVNVREKENKAFVRNTIFLVLILSLNVLFFLVSSPLRTYLFMGMVLLASVFVFWLFISPAPKKSIEVIGDQNKIDERDVFFARFDLGEGTQVFQDYYSGHPEFGSPIFAGTVSFCSGR